MATEDLARQHYASRRRLSEAVAKLASRAWSRLNPANLDASWAGVAPELLVGLAGAQLAAARAADDYTDDVLGEPSSTRVNASALAGVASDGRPLDSLLTNSLTVVKTAVASGIDIRQAMGAGYANLDMLVRTQLADAGRAADQVALVAHPAAEGYTRTLVGKSCSRCLVLAGRWYAWNAGFRRHPRCDCIHVPGRSRSDGLEIDPRRSFEAMSRAEQDKTFTLNGAQAIREGADIGRVVNARRGMATAGETRTRVRSDGLVVNERIRRQTTTRVGGRDVFTTTEAAGRKPRLMPEEIYRIAGNDRDEARRLLRSNGYLTDARPRVARPVAPKVALPTPAREPIMQAPKQRVVPPKPAAAPVQPKASPTPAAAGSSLQRGIASGIRESKPLKGGEVGDVRLVTFNDGTQAIQKIAHKEFVYSPKILTDHEYLAGLVGRAIGAPIPEVIRTGETEVFMEYIAGTRPAMAVFRKYKVAERGAKVSEFIDTREGRRLGLFDLLVANGDRHLGNWLVRKDGSIVGIDHGIAWPTGQITPEKIERSYPSFDGPFAGMYHEGFLGLSKPSRGWKANDLTDEDVRWVRDRLNSLRPDFEAAGHGNWLDYSLARLRQLGAWAGGDVNQVKP